MEAPLRPERAASLLRSLQTIFPKAGRYDVRQEWTDFRPPTPSSHQLLGPTAIEGLYLNCGHGSLGWTLAMGSVERLAASIGSPSGL